MNNLLRLSFIPLLAGLVMVVILWVFVRVRPAPLNRGFRILQIASGSFLAFAHGTNDAQKTMGVITLALVAHGNLPSTNPTVPTWVVVTAASAIALGRLPIAGRMSRSGQRNSQGGAHIAHEPRA